MQTADSAMREMFLERLRRLLWLRRMVALDARDGLHPAMPAAVLDRLIYSTVGDLRDMGCAEEAAAIVRGRG